MGNPSSTQDLTLLGRDARVPASPEEARLERVPNPEPGLLYLVRCWLNEQAVEDLLATTERLMARTHVEGGGCDSGRVAMPVHLLSAARTGLFVVGTVYLVLWALGLSG